MAATPRSVAASQVDGETGTAERGDAQPGDVLLAFHSADELGGLAGMTISGGGTWTPLEELAASNWSGSRIWRKPVGGSEPDEYDIAQGTADTAGVVIILVIRGGDPNSIVVTKQVGSVAPAATPASASGLEIRYSAGAPSLPTSWAQHPGYDGLDVQNGAFTTAGLAVRPYLSSGAVGELDMAPSPPLDDAHSHAFTLLIRSLGGSAPGGGEIPTPPSFPAFTPTKGVARTSYTVHDVLTGSYVGDIHPAAGLAYDRRDGEAGGWSGTLPMPNRREADRIAEIIPRDPEDLSSGPGRLVIHSWREGVPWGVHWLHTTEVTRTARGGLAMQLQGTTLDGYMNSVSLEEDVAFGDDQIVNARDFIAHMSADSRSNPGFALQGGTSGLVRPLIAAQADNTTYGRVLRDYSQVDGGFGYVIDPTLVGSTLERRWRWGSPRLDLDQEWIFTESREGAGEITGWRELRSALSGGTRIGVIGGVPEAEDATQDRTAVRSELIETPHLAAGWPIIDLRLNRASTDLTELERYALRYAATAAGAPRVFSMDVILGKGSDFDPNGIGGWVTAVMNNDWHIRTASGGAFAMPAQRLIGWALTPGGRGAGKDRLQVVTAQEAA
ncbi:hypothetical protein ACLQ2R_03130 [Streptosporangium sp. DT93]|uniref:hypothetical protein n=1 Tax=Streptosporangium sp. DT93 TaxID=3393428 RepID=UPI003CECBD83